MTMYSGLKADGADDDMVIGKQGIVRFGNDDGQAKEVLSKIFA